MDVIHTVIDKLKRPLKFMGIYPHSEEIEGCLAKEVTFDLDLEEQVRF